MKTYNVYAFTRTAEGTIALEQFATTDARRVLRAVRGTLNSGTHINVIVNGKSVAHV